MSPGQAGGQAQAQAFGVRAESGDSVRLLGGHAESMQWWRAYNVQAGQLRAQHAQQAAAAAPANQKRSCSPSTAQPPHRLARRSSMPRALQCCDGVSATRTCTTHQTAQLVSRSFQPVNASPHCCAASRPQVLPWSSLHCMHVCGPHTPSSPSPAPHLAAWVLHLLPPVQLGHVCDAQAGKPAGQPQRHIPRQPRAKAPARSVSATQCERNAAREVRCAS